MHQVEYAVVDGLTLETVRTYASEHEAEEVAAAMNAGVGPQYRVVRIDRAEADLKNVA